MDLDGTLLPSTTACLHIAREAGVADRMRAALANFERGAITNAQFIDAFIPVVAGRRRSEITQSLAALPTLEGIAEGVTLLRDAGARTLINTVTWRLAAAWFAERWNVDRATGWELAEGPTSTTLGSVCTRYVNAGDKVQAIREACAEWGISLDRTIHVGDSSSDIDAFRFAALAIAVDPSNAAAAAADIVLTNVSSFSSIADAVVTWACH